MNKLSPKVLALTFGVFWAASIFFVDVINQFFAAGYGQNFLDLVASIYPGYASGGGLKGLVVGTFYGFVDGLVGGFIFAWVYNFISDKCK